jgi:hypothetical protein
MVLSDTPRASRNVVIHYVNISHQKHALDCYLNAAHKKGVPGAVPGT